MNSIVIIRAIFTSALFAAVLLCFHRADAQQMQSDAPAPAEEIVVTAQRREENLRDIPVAVSAFSASEIQNATIDQVNDLSAYVPGLELNGWSSVGFSAPNIRGIAADAARTGAEPAAGVYIDEVYFGSNASLNNDLFAIERVEVLRGPQGTLYGKNTIAGAINIISKKPTQEVQISGDARMGNYDSRRFRGNLSGPILDGVLLGQLSFFSSENEGYTENRFDGSVLNSIDASGARAFLRWLAGDDTTVDLSAFSTRDRGTGRAADAGDPDLDLIPELVLGYEDGDPFDFSVSQNHRAIEYRDVNSGNVRIDHELETLTITSLSAFVEWDYENPADTDGSPFDFVIDNVRGNASQISQEFRAVSNTSGPLEWILGAYFLRSKLHAESVITLGEDLSLFGIPEDTANSFADQITTSYAGFGQLTYQLTSRLAATAGLRYTYETKEFEFRQDGGDAGLFAEVPPGERSESWDFVSGVATIAYVWPNEAMTYVTASKASKSGGYNDGLNGPGALTPYDPENVTNLEAGLKASFWSGRGLFSSAAYYLWWDDIQLRYLPPGTTFFVVANAGNQQRYGLEAELSLMPADGLKLDVAYAHQKLDSAENVLVPTEEAIGITTPENTLSVRGQYEFPVSAGLKMYIRGEYEYRSKTDSSAVQPDPALQQQERKLFSARIGLKTKDDKWGFYLWGRNLTDEAFIVNAGDLSQAFGPGFPLLPKQVWLGPPRTYGLEVTFRY